MDETLSLLAQEQEQLVRLEWYILRVAPLRS
jgi:hypothetical protein